jgi:hypothetical protein
VVCSYRTRFACPLVESPLPDNSLQGSRKLSGNSLQGSRKLSEHIPHIRSSLCNLEACSLRVQQFGGKHGQSWKVAEKLNESDSYVILCV